MYLPVHDKHFYIFEIAGNFFVFGVRNIYIVIIMLCFFKNIRMILIINTVNFDLRNYVAPGLLRFKLNLLTIQLRDD